jgi:hypothetical protein
MCRALRISSESLRAARIVGHIIPVLANQLQTRRAWGWLREPFSRLAGMDAPAGALAGQFQQTGQEHVTGGEHRGPASADDPR